jgi:hypothetical protein
MHHMHATIAPSALPGRSDAAALAEELAPAVEVQAAALRELGLHQAWASLRGLAAAGGAQQQREQREQQQQQEGVPGQEAWALQQRVHQYRAKCRQMKASACRPACLSCASFRVHPCLCGLFPVCLIVRRTMHAAARSYGCFEAVLSASAPPACAPPPQATIAALEAAASRWQAAAGEMEQGLVLLRFRWG